MYLNNGNVKKWIATYLGVLFILGYSCNVSDSDNKKNKMVPDNTPFIASTLEVTDDTVHHYPEVYVGTVTFIDGFYDNRICCDAIPGIWWPTLNAQVNKTARKMDLVRTDIDDAEVTIAGPLETELEQTVKFKSEGLGVYGDQDYKLKLIENGRYRLEVTMPDGSQYRAITTLPELAQWPVPDTLRPELDLLQNGDVFVEQTPGRKRLRLEYEEAQNAELTVLKINESDDRETFFVGKDEQFLYENKGKYLRDGATYAIKHNTESLFADSTTFGPLWFEDSETPLKESVDVWMYLRQNNADMSNPWHYQPIFNFIGVSSDDLWSRQDQEFVDARFAVDSDYLFEISNILKVGDNGEVLPEEQSDAIGIFGGFSTVYRKTVMKPRRSWDPDSLGWGPENE